MSEKGPEEGKKVELESEKQQVKQKTKENQEQNHKEQLKQQAEKQLSQKQSEKPPEEKDASPKKIEQQQQQQFVTQPKYHQQLDTKLTSVKIIQDLSQKIVKAQQSLADTEEVLELEAKEKQQLLEEVRNRNMQLKKLMQLEEKGIGAKIEQKITQILEETIQQKMQVQQERDKQHALNYEYKMRLQELKQQQHCSNIKQQEQNSKINTLNAAITEIKQTNQTKQSQLEQTQNELKCMQSKRQSIENQYLQLKQVLERMNDLKGVLNRLLTNPDLFTGSMELKPQQIVTPQRKVPTNPVRAKKPLSQEQPNNRLKPLSREQDNEDDFWQVRKHK